MPRFDTLARSFPAIRTAQFKQAVESRLEVLVNKAREFTESLRLQHT